MEFDERLKRAVERGHRRNEEAARLERQKELSEHEVKSRHSRFRLKLSEHIESCMQRLPNHFPGFQYETIFGERGWGGACFRDDLDAGDHGRRANFYSRLEMTIRPLGQFPILELAAKGTVRNKEAFTRSHYEEIEHVDLDSFVDLIDLWIVEYAEFYASKG